MNQKSKNTKKVLRAFSLIEMSLVILVIGAMVASIMGSTVIIDKYRLYLARSLTESSPVSITKNLKLWYETTSKKSFVDTETGNGLAISTWYDRNTLSNARNNAQGTADNRPTYITKCVNGLPCIRFDGSNDYMYFDGTFLVATDFTVFVVEQRRTDADGNFFLSGNGGTTNSNLILGYRYNGTVTFSMFSNDLEASVPNYIASTPKIHVFTMSSSTGKSYYLNGVTTQTEPTQTDQLVSLDNYSLGLSNIANFYYNGDLCEVIIFDRAINDDERRNIEAYLSQKWKITVS